MSTNLEAPRVPVFTIADRLRKAREEAGLAQHELAEAMGASRGTVSNYELGVYPPKRPVLLAWAMATGVPLEWLETGKTTTGPGGPSGQQGAVEPTAAPDAEGPDRPTLTYADLTWHTDAFFAA
jgi:transcriptional regulator with XRE-family HTH domain